MTDVLKGGCTAFPAINIVSPAIKGTTLVWYNFILSNGSDNKETVHGSCPMLNGNKWS